jgi:hypothetical protein
VLGIRPEHSYHWANPHPVSLSFNPVLFPPGGGTPVSIRHKAAKQANLTF